MRKITSQNFAGVTVHDDFVCLDTRSGDGILITTEVMLRIQEAINYHHGARKLILESESVNKV